MEQQQVPAFRLNSGRAIRVKCSVCRAYIGTNVPTRLCIVHAPFIPTEDRPRVIKVGTEKDLVLLGEGTVLNRDAAGGTDGSQ